MGELRYNIPCTKPGGKPSITLESTNGKWQSVTSVDFGGADVSFNSGWWVTKALSSITNGTITNTDLSQTHCALCYENSALTTFDCSLPNLTNGEYMFKSCTSLSSFTTNLPQLISGYSMFWGCNSLTSFSVDMPQLIKGGAMFEYCENLQSFSADLSNLTGGSDMFLNCSNLTAFSANCSSLTSYTNMFHGDTALTDVQMIIPNELSAKTAMNFGISGCPATAYTCFDWMDRDKPRLTFSENHIDYIVIADGGYSYFFSTNDTENNTTTLTF